MRENRDDFSRLLVPSYVPGKAFAKRHKWEWASKLHLKRWPKSGWNFSGDTFLKAVLDRPPYKWIPAHLERHHVFGGGKNVRAIYRWWWHGFVRQFPVVHDDKTSWAYLCSWLRRNQEPRPTCENMAICLREGYYEEVGRPGNGRVNSQPPIYKGPNSLLTEAAILGMRWIVARARKDFRETLDDLVDHLPQAAETHVDVIQALCEVGEKAYNIGCDGAQGAGARVAALETARRVLADVAYHTREKAGSLGSTPDSVQSIKQGAERILGRVKGGTGRLSSDRTARQPSQSTPSSRPGRDPYGEESA